MGNYLSGVEIVYFSYFFEGYMMTFCCLPQLNAPITPSTIVCEALVGTIQ